MKTITYIWVISKFELKTETIEGFIKATKVPTGEKQESNVTDEKNLWKGNCTIEDAQKYIDDRWPGHLVLEVQKQQS